MKFFLLNATILSIIFSISAYQPHFYSQYEADQSAKLPIIYKMNQYLTERYENLNKVNSHDYYGNDEDYEKFISSSTVQASVTTTTPTTTPVPAMTTPVSNTTDIFDELYDKIKDTKGQYEDEQEDEDEDEDDYEKDENDKAKSDADKKDADDDEYNSGNQNKPKEYELSVEKLLKSIKKIEKTATYDDENDDEKDDESDNDDEDDDDDDNTDEDFDYTTQTNDAEKDQDNDEDEDEDDDYQKENKNSKQMKSVINNILDFIQLDRLFSSVSDIFKQSSQSAQIDSNEEEPSKKKKSLVVVLFSNKKQPKPSSLASASDYEQKTVIRSSASKLAKDCSNESVQINILRTVTKVSLFLASVTLCVLILLTLLRFCLVRNKKSSSSNIGYNKLENIDTILEKV